MSSIPSSSPYHALAVAAQTVRTETLSGANTAERLGDLLYELAETLESERVAVDSAVMVAHDAATQAAVQASTARSEVSDLSLSVRGYGDEASGYSFPFVRVESFKPTASQPNYITAFNDWLDAVDIRPTASYTKYVGTVRTDIYGALVTVEHYPLYYAENSFVQVVRGPLTVLSTGKVGMLAADASGYATLYRHHRPASSGGGWTDWKVQ